jgi:hypothetical protein
VPFASSPAGVSCPFGRIFHGAEASSPRSAPSPEIYGQEKNAQVFIKKLLERPNKAGGRQSAPVRG